MTEWELKRTRQCGNCPWRKGSDTSKIPGYQPELHDGLARTIADQGDPLSNLRSKTFRFMACHAEEDSECIGWLMNQLGPGNNIALRIRVRNCTNIGEAELVGEQYETFEAMRQREG